MMAEYVLHGLIYIICEVYIDDLLIYGRNEEEFLRNVETVFERLREYNVTLNPKKVHLGLQTISFVGHEIDSEGINMSQKRVESTIDVIRPTNLKELYSFIGLVNYFHDHIPHHATVAKPLTQMVSVANQSKTKSILWTDAGVHAFQVLKNLVNVCPKLYYIDYQSDIVLCTDASDYAIGAYLYQKAKNTPNAIEQPIRFLSKTLTPVQSRWSTIEKEAYAIYYALQKLEDLLGGVQFTLRTDHNNLIFMNQNGSRKVLNWKLSIQHFNFFIEHIKGVDNIPADVFSRLVPRTGLIVNNIVLSRCTTRQHDLIKACHEHHYAHWGVQKTLNLLKSYHPEETSKDLWSTFLQDVRDFIQCCPTCQKMIPLQAVIKAPRFVLSTVSPMTRIAIDTIGPFPTDMGFSHIIVIIDTFSRYIELFHTTDVTATSAASALWQHSCRFRTPNEIMTDKGSQFMNETLTKFANLAGITHLSSIPYSKEENGIVERANKEVNRLIRNILFDHDVIDEWSSYLHMMEKLFNSSIKQPTGTSPNTLVFGGLIDANQGFLMTEPETNKTKNTRSIRDHVDKLMHQQSTLIAVALKVQQTQNSKNLEKRYKNYKRTPRLHPTRYGEEPSPKIPDDIVTRPVYGIAGINESLTVSSLNVSSDTNLDTHDTIKVYDWTWDPSLNPPRYVKTKNTNSETTTVVELDMAPYQLTAYSVGDFVLREYPPTKAGKGPPNKYSSWWRGPYEITNVQRTDVKNIYTIRNLVTQHEYVADVTHLKPFYHDPTYVVPLNIAVKDTDEYVVDQIVGHNISDPTDTKWRVRWAGYEASDDTWEPLANIKDVEVFHEYCVDNKLQRFIPRKHSKRLREEEDGHTKRAKH